jgi:hypothetical protein
MLRIGRIRPALAAIGVLGLGLLASPCFSSAEEPDRVLTLTLPRQPAANETIALRISVGVLPRRARMVVRTADGEIAGTIAPFGIRPGRDAGEYTIRVPDKAVRGDKVTLHLVVLEKDAEESRRPTCSEIKSAKLAFITVAPPSGRPEKPAKPPERR